MIDTSHYRELFFSEAEELIRGMNRSLLSLEKNPKEKGLIEETFRAVHTLKGMAGTMEFQGMTRVAHEMENVLDSIRQGKLFINSEIVGILLRSVDILEEACKNEGKALGIEECISELKRCSDKKESRVEKAEEKYILYIKLKKDIEFKQARILVIMHDIEKLSTIEETIPSVEKMGEPGFSGEVSIFLFTDNSKEVLNRVRSYSEIESASIKREIEEHREVREEEPERKQIKAIGPEIRISEKQLDNLVVLVGEMFTVREQFRRISKQYNIEVLDETTRRFSKLVDDLESEVMSARLTRASVAFERFPRLVRDQAYMREKEIDFFIEGGEIELDRSLLEKASESLIHLLRNAVDHGIELPKERIKKGKKRSGTVRLIVKRSKENCFLSVEDDGAGINPDLLRNEAIRRGILSLDEAKVLGEREILKLLGKPGFTTAGKITETSGRGVGLDVVINAVRLMGGRLSIDSKLGFGSSFTMILPLSIAVLRTFLVRVGRRTFGLPISFVREAIHLEPESVKRVGEREVFFLRDEVIPLFEKKDLFGERGSGESRRAVVVVEADEKKAGVVVDSFLGQEEIVVKSLDPLLFSDVKDVSGVSLTADGKPVLILDIMSILSP